MPRVQNGKVHNVYLIDKYKLTTQFESDDIKGSLELLVAEANSKICNRANKYKPQTLSQEAVFEGYTCLLYFADISVPQKSFNSFFSPFVNDDQKILHAHSAIPSFLMFLYKENYIFCIAGGNGYNAISNYLIPKFGLVILSNYTNDFRITSYGDNTIDNKVHAQQTTYRRVASFVDLDRWNKLFNSMTGKIENREIIAELLNLGRDEEKKSISITAKTSMQIGNKLNISKFIKLITKYEELLTTNDVDNFNIFVALDKKSSEQITANNKAVISRLFEEFTRYQQTQIADSEFDFFAEDNEKFIKCTETNIYYSDEKVFQNHREGLNVTRLIFEGFENLVENGKLQNNEVDFMRYILSSSVGCYENDNPINSIKDTVLRYISGEIIEGDKKYFIFYGSYYLVEQNYISFLNERLSEKLTDTVFVSLTDVKWITNEDKFNADCRDNVNKPFIHLHKIIPSNIEFCDLLKFQDGKAYIVHVKDHFDGNMRELSRQVELSHKCLQELKNANNESYFSTLYDKAIASNDCKPNLEGAYTKAEFINNLVNLAPVFVIALHIGNKDLRRIEQFESNIAKHCLYDSFLYMRNNDKDFNIQIIEDN